MGVHHLISICEEQLRNWPGDHRDLLGDVGTAVVLACLDPDNKDVAIRADTLDARGDQMGPLITVQHVDKHEADEFSVWAWSTGDSVCIADLSDQDLDLIIKLAHAVRTKTVDDHGNLSPTAVPD
jgi:hypothetical protein